MKKQKLYNSLVIVLVALMLAGAGYLGYAYLKLSNALGQITVKNAADAVPLTRQFVHLLGGVAAANVLLALLTVAVLLGGRSADVQVVYVKKNEDEKQENTEEKTTEATVGMTGSTHQIESLLRQEATSLKPVFEQVLVKICRDLEASQAAFYIAKRYEGRRVLELFATYAFHIAESKTFHYEFGEGLAGQVAKEGRPVVIKNVPEGYVNILSGLGKAAPAELLIVPVLHDGQVVAVAEIASFQAFTPAGQAYVEEVARLAGPRLADQFANEEIAMMV
jgi:putative methionine-R-sulfoxide reductase with GAF domain